MHPNEALIHRFYDAFARKDFSTMQDAYHPEASFSDPVFPDLSFAEVKAMWEMLITASTDLRISFDDVSADEGEGGCRWQAVYTFSSTGRKVHNVIRARFHFRDGLIVRHEDHFDFWRWSRMALGMPGILLGWSPFLQNSVRARARRRLDRYVAG
jgi:ketosteroid isomerase-like protein